MFSSVGFYIPRFFIPTPFGKDVSQMTACICKGSASGKDDVHCGGLWPDLLQGMLVQQVEDWFRPLGSL